MAVFPRYYRPRPYQAELHAMWRSKRFGVGVLPRQTGKDVAASMEQCDRRLKEPKTTGVYISLNNPMIRDILWDKTYIDPVSNQYIRGLQDNVPSDAVKWTDTTMTGAFSNGSRLKLQGYFQSGQDKSGVGTAFQDYTITELALFTRENPIPRLLPIINNRAEEKRLMAVSTPRGRRKNPLWLLMQSIDGNPEAQVIVRTMADINEIMRRNGLPPVLTEAELEVIEDTYLKLFGNSRMFEQEYHCSFEEIDAAAVYGEAYMQMIRDKRIAPFNPQHGHPIYVVFDIGSAGMHSDATAWIAFQWINGKHFIYDCGEGHGKALPDYVDELREKHWFSRLDTIILPWDAEHHEVSITETPADMMRKKYAKVAVLAKSRQAFKLPGGRQGDFTQITDIQATRMALYNTLINGNTPDESDDGTGLWVPPDADVGPRGPGLCDWLVECLENYKYKFDPATGLYSSTPVHDRHSHMMDALRYMVQATKEFDFFGGTWFEATNGAGPKESSVDYTQDWSGVW